jgi:hypothetical protein
LEHVEREAMKVAFVGQVCEGRHVPFEGDW